MWERGVWKKVYMSECVCRRLDVTDANKFLLSGFLEKWNRSFPRPSFCKLYSSQLV